MRIHFVIPGGPRTKKNSSTLTLRGQRPLILPSKAYRGWFQEAMAWSPILKAKLQQSCPGLKLPLDGPLSIRARFCLDRDYRSDLGGLYQALTDWLQEPRIKPQRNGAGFIMDDYQIVRVDCLERIVDPEKPRIEVKIETL